MKPLMAVSALLACYPECQCGGDGTVERGGSGATYSYPCYPWDCRTPNCRCKEPLKEKAQ